MNAAMPATAPPEADEDPHVELLHDLLAPLEEHYLLPEVEEIAVCAPFTVFHRLRNPDSYGRIWRPAHDARLNHEYLMLVMHAVANTYKINFGPDTVPVLYASLPINHRFTAVCGHSVVYDHIRPEGGIAMSIRQAPRTDFRPSLEDFGIDEEHTPDQPLRPGPELLRSIRSATTTTHESLFEAARSGHPLLFSGATSSGKSSLLNLLLREINTELRIITIEDARELLVDSPPPNRMHLLTPRAYNPLANDGSLDPGRIVDLIMRSTPDAVLLGEISTRNAAMALELIGSGHSHFWTSIHADTPSQALRAFADRVRHSDNNADSLDVIERLRKQFIIVQTQRHHDERAISDIVYPDP